MNTKLIANAKYVDEIKWPPSISIDITGKCNLRCSHCFAKDHPQIDLPFEKIKYVVDSMQGLRSVELGLAEPTLHPDFEKIVDYIHAKGIKLGMATNGITIRNGLIKKETLQKFSWLFISITNDIDRGCIVDYRSLPCKYSLVYIYTSKTKNDYAALCAQTLYLNMVQVQIRLDMNDYSLIERYKKDTAAYEMNHCCDAVKLNFIQNDRYTSYSGECYYAHLKLLLMNDGYWYPCCVETAGLDYSYKYKLCAWNEIDKLISSKVYVDCKHCSKVESLHAINKYLQDTDKEFMI